MTLDEVKRELGIEGIRKVSEHTITVVLNNGHCYPASLLEQRMWKTIKRLVDETGHTTVNQ